jgi:hypothetical protein
VVPVNRERDGPGSVFCFRIADSDTKYVDNIVSNISNKVTQQQLIDKEYGVAYHVEEDVKSGQIDQGHQSALFEYFNSLYRIISIYFFCFVNCLGLEFLPLDLN